VQIAIVDYGVGNLYSVNSALSRVAPEADVILTSSPEKVASADKLVFPGVGAIGHCLEQLNRSGLLASVEAALDEKPVLAICIGMQMLFEHSSESGGVKCLGRFMGDVEHFSTGPKQSKLSIPHMGWSKVQQQIDHPVWHSIQQDERFYFVHSYRVAKTAHEHCLATARYGTDFVAAAVSNNLIATQFHPEKSGLAGLQLIKNFTRL